MGKARFSSRKLGIPGTISCKDRHNKEQKWHGHNRKKKILRRGGKNTQNYTKKYFLDPDNHGGEITHLEPDILVCDVKWALGSITMNKAIGTDGIPVELFQILKDYAIKVLHSMCQQIWKTQQWPQDWKRSVFTPVPKKGNAKECSKLLHDCTHLTCQQSNAQNSPSEASTVHEP